jgi:glycosyltransferase involved in cell wall biosynthesis
MPNDQRPGNDLRVLIVAENASLKFGGEATKPFLFFKFFRQRGMDARLLVHSRCRAELEAAFPNDLDRMYFIPDTTAHKVLWQVGRRIPAKVDEQTLGFVRHQITQALQRRIARDLVRRYRIDVVHEPTPISPKQVSMMFDLGAPVVIGPMCGGMDYPPGFQYMQSGFARSLERAGRAVAQLFHEALPGKLRAAALVVANDRTRLALPRGCRGQVYEMPESGVELKGYPPIDYGSRADGDGAAVRFIYLGRLVDWKAVDLLLDAFKGVADHHPTARLEVLGDGPELGPLRRRADELMLGADRVEFAGWVNRATGMERLRAADVFVLPSLRECGGNALLEAMAVGLPCIGTNWGGPGKYLDDTCGVRVEPDSRDGFVAGLTRAMLKLAGSRDLRLAMGAAGRRRLSEHYFTWESKVARMLEIYRDTIKADRNATHPPGGHLAA